MNKELLYRFFEGSSTYEEEIQIKHWVEKSKENYQQFLNERKLYDAVLLAGTASMSLNNNKMQISPPSYRKAISAVAAVIALLLISGIYMMNFINSAERKYTTVLVPPGQRINIVLADKSNVWLNSNTKFKYPSDFSKKNRMVFLDGEAYFDVSKDAKRPFIVKTSQGDVRVKGTDFNVEAYSNQDFFETSLFSGEVEIYKNDKKLISLKPNEKMMMEKNRYHVSRIENTDEYLWREGLIAFNNKKLDEILSSFEKYFDVEICIKTSELPTCSYTGKFRQADGIDYALRVLQRNICFSYVRDEDSGTIKINSNH